MKPQKKSRQQIPQAHLGLALILIGLAPVIARGQETSATNPSVMKAETRSAISASEAKDHKADLDALDREIEAIEQRLDHASEGPERTAAKMRLEALKDRRTELRKAYVGAKFDQLKADTRAEYEKVAAWTKDKYEAVKENLSGPEPDVVAQTSATVNPAANAAMTDIALYKMNPSPENKEEVKLALDALEDEIDRLEDRADAMPKSEQRTALERRINALEDRKDDLEDNFTKARWDALVADVKREWNDLVN